MSETLLDLLLPAMRTDHLDWSGAHFNLNSAYSFLSQMRKYQDSLISLIIRVPRSINDTSG